MKEWRYSATCAEDETHTHILTSMKSEFIKDICYKKYEITLLQVQSVLRRTRARNGRFI
jgi:hypothetical protein